MLVTAIFPLFVFVLDTDVAAIAPPLAQFTSCLEFGAPLAARR